MYVKCCALCLNLALVSACTSHKENPTICYFFGIVQLVFNFVEGRPKRHAVFESIVMQTKIKHKALKPLSETRWACRSEAVSVIFLQLKEIVRAIEESTASTSDSKVQASTPYTSARGKSKQSFENPK